MLPSRSTVGVGPVLLPFALASRAHQIAPGHIANAHSRPVPKVQEEESEGEGDHWAASNPKMHVNGGQ